MYNEALPFSYRLITVNGDNKEKLIELARNSVDKSVVFDSCEALWYWDWVDKQEADSYVKNFPELEKGCFLVQKCYYKKITRKKRFFSKSVVFQFLKPTFYQLVYSLWLKTVVEYYLL